MKILSFVLTSVRISNLVLLENIVFVGLDNETWLSVGSGVAMT